MAANSTVAGFTDPEWAVWEPLIEAVRPRGKTLPQELRQTIAAIFWRHRNGARWRAIPSELGPWWRAAQLFIRWAQHGAWEHLLGLAQEHVGGLELSLTFLDGTQRASVSHGGGGAQTGGTSASRDHREALGRSRGGFGTKAVAVADSRGRAVSFAVAPGQAHEAPMTPAMLQSLPDTPVWIVADRGYSSDAIRTQVWDMNARPAIPAKRNAAAQRCPHFIYVHRNQVEQLWGRLKGWAMKRTNRAVATRYEKTAHSFKGVLCLAAAFD